MESSSSQREILRQQERLHSLELDEAAYQAAAKAQDCGDLPEAARWYRVAAINDFAEASLKLAKVLDSLAAGYRTRLESRTARQEEMALVTEAARWYVEAYATGHIEAAELLDKLIATHSPGTGDAQRDYAGHG